MSKAREEQIAALKTHKQLVEKKLKNMRTTHSLYARTEAQLSSIINRLAAMGVRD